MILRFQLAMAALALAVLVGVAVALLVGGQRPGEPPLLDALRRAGLVFERVVSALEALFVEPSVGTGDRARIARAADADVVHVQREFGHAFDPQPAAYVFGSPSSFAHGLRTALGRPAAQAQAIASRHGGLFDPASGGILVNWQLVRAVEPVTILRHELAHAMIRQIVGPRAELPAWLEEGLASVVEQSARPGRDGALEDSYIANALLAGQQASLARLVTSESWIRESAALEGETYPIAATAARRLRGEVGEDGVQRLLKDVGGGSTFGEAFVAVSGGSVEAFVATFGELAAEAAPPAEIAVDARPNERGDVTWRVRGFVPGSTAIVTITGTTEGGVPYRLPYEITIDGRGSAAGTFGSTAPPGTYAISVESGGRAVSAVLKTDEF